MNLSVETRIAADAHGVLRVKGTRIPIDTVIIAFNDGASPEAITDMYPSLQLADVYSVLDFYLQRKTDVDIYLAEREKKAEIMRAEIERRFPTNGLRDRLLARKAAQEGVAGDSSSR